jgi:hypothetical protein
MTAFVELLCAAVHTIGKTTLAAGARAGAEHCEARRVPHARRHPCARRRADGRNESQESRNNPMQCRRGRPLKNPWNNPMQSGLEKPHLPARHPEVPEGRASKDGMAVWCSPARPALRAGTSG